MNSKTYTLPNGKEAVFEYDVCGIGKVTIEAMDMLMGLIADGRKSGEWIRTRFVDCGSPIDECSICGHYINGDMEVRNFCPNCGADMRGKNDE